MPAVLQAPHTLHGRRPSVSRFRRGHFSSGLKCPKMNSGGCVVCYLSTLVFFSTFVLFSTFVMVEYSMFAHAISADSNVVIISTLDVSANFAFS